MRDAIISIIAVTIAIYFALCTVGFIFGTIAINDKDFCKFDTPLGYSNLGYRLGCYLTTPFDKEQ